MFHLRGEAALEEPRDETPRRSSAGVPAARGGSAGVPAPWEGEDVVGEGYQQSAPSLVSTLEGALSPRRRQDLYSLDMEENGGCSAAAADLREEGAGGEGNASSKASSEARVNIMSAADTDR